MKQKGTTLVETLIAASIFLIVSISIYEVYTKILEFTATIRATTVAAQIAGEQMEFVRNLQYTDVGVQGGIPSGVVPANKTVTRNGVTFNVDTTIRNVDFPADGTLGGTPNDLSPADDKLVTIEVTCTSCKTPKTVTHTSYVAPKNLETENGNGAIVIKAIDANGIPVVGADVTIQNTSLSPAVNMSDVTDAYGVLTIVDAPPSAEGYNISVTKNGYSTERTYQTGAAGNPNPVKPYLTVTQNTVTQSTFSIDKTSTVTLNAQSTSCTPLSNITGNLSGVKVIGTSPTVLKNQIPFTLASGSQTISNIEWDNYGIALGGTTYDISAIDTALPLSILPNTTRTVTMTLKPAAANRLIVAVVDDAGNPITGATVSVTGVTGSRITGTTPIGQTDWSGGTGQADYTDQTKYSSASGVDGTAIVGQLALATSGSAFVSSGTLTSSTIDFGAPITPLTLSWNPTSQPAATGATPVKFQIATNNDNSTWDFLGPDGTNATYYTSTNASISSVHANTRYLRYKVYLTTDDVTVTPNVSDISISACVPVGQVDFGGLAGGAHTITVSKAGYTTATKDITISGNGYEVITLTPQ